MKNLDKLQKNFISSVFSENEDLIEKDLVTDKISAKGLMDIYRKNASGGMGVAMELIYPVVNKIVGDNFFAATCREFSRFYKPTSGNLDEYGKEFGHFLENFPPAQSLPYLPDIAKLEWAFHLSGIAKKSNSLEQDAISSIPQEKYFDLHFTLHPSVHFISSKYPIHKIWEIAVGESDEDGLNLDEEGGADLLIVRKNKKTEIVILNPAELAFLEALKDGASFYEAFEAAEKKDEAFDLAFYLSQHIVHGTFSGFLLGH